MAENKAFSGDEAETDFGGVETAQDVEITVDSKLDDGEIPEPYAGMPAEVLLLHSRKKGWVIGCLIGWLGKSKFGYISLTQIKLLLRPLQH